MPLEHLLRYAVGVPLLAGFLLAGALRLRSGPRWPVWTAWLFGAALLGALAFNPNFLVKAPWSSAEAALPWAALAWAGVAAWPGRFAPLAFLLPAAFYSWRTFVDVSEYYGWSTIKLCALIAVSTVAAAASAWLAREVARRHPASASLSASSVIALGASAVLLLGRTAKGAEFCGVLAALLGLPLLMAFRAGRSDDASAWAVPFAGAIHAVLLFGLLQAEALWISVALLVVLAPAAGLIGLRDQRPLPRAAAVAFVTGLPAAAAIFLAWFKAEAVLSPGGGGLPY